MRYFRRHPSGGGIVKCEKKSFRVSGGDGGRDNPVEVHSENLARRYPKHSSDEKMKGIVTSCASLEDISPTETRNSLLVLGDACETSYDVCAICDDAKPHGEMWRGDHCRHSCCEACIKEYVVGKVKENIHEIKCPETKCKKNLDKEFLQEIIADSEELVDAWVDAKREAKLLGNPTHKTKFMKLTKFMEQNFIIILLFALVLPMTFGLVVRIDSPYERSAF